MNLASILYGGRRRARPGERGQAMVEAAIFIPVMLLMLFAVIFFDRLGLISERSESAVRYGDMVAFRGGSAYSVSIVQDLVSQALYHNTPNQLLDLCLQPGTTTNPTSGNVTAAMQAALTQSQVAPNTTVPNGEPSAKPFWKPDTISNPSCSPGTIDLSQSSPTGVGNLPLSVNSFDITAGVNIPSYLVPVLTGTSSKTGQSSTGADMAFINVATPSTLIACVPGLKVVLSVINPLATGAVPCT